MNSRKKNRSKPITAGELLDKLEKDTEHITRMEELEERKRQAREEYMQAAAPVLDELTQAGFIFNNPAYGIYEIYANERYRNKSNYERAIPILLRWLPRIENLRVKKDILRTLAVKWARPVAAPILIAEFLRGDANIKWAIGNALSAVADDSVFDDIVDLVQDKQHGKSREMVVVALGNMQDPRAVEILIELLDDEQITSHAIIALGRLKSIIATPHIKKFLDHPNAGVRKEARRALAKIEKAK